MHKLIYNMTFLLLITCCLSRPLAGKPAWTSAFRLGWPLAHESEGEGHKRKKRGHNGGRDTGSRASGVWRRASKVSRYYPDYWQARPLTWDS